MDDESSHQYGNNNIPNDMIQFNNNGDNDRRILEYVNPDFLLEIKRDSRSFDNKNERNKVNAILNDSSDEIYDDNYAQFDLGNIQKEQEIHQEQFYRHYKAFMKVFQNKMWMLIVFIALILLTLYIYSFTSNMMFFNSVNVTKTNKAGYWWESFFKKFDEHFKNYQYNNNSSENSSRSNSNDDNIVHSFHNILVDDERENYTCSNTYQGKEFVADDRGYVCYRNFLDPLHSGCCLPSFDSMKNNDLFLSYYFYYNQDIKNGEEFLYDMIDPKKIFDRYQCNDRCDSEKGCCHNYEFCVSCCLNPDKTELYVSTFNLNQNMLLDRPLRFEFCKSICRTSSKSISNNNEFIEPDFKYCYL